VPTQLTVVDVWNGALDHVSEQPVNDVGENNTYTRWILRNYPNMLDAELRANPWNFAIEYHELTPNVLNPKFRWRRSFTLPVNGLRWLPPTYWGERDADTIPHEIVGNDMYMNETGTNYLRVVMRVVEPGRWDPLFAEAFMAALAVKMALKFTGKETYLTKAQNLYTAAIQRATTADALEGSAEPVEQHEVINVRYR
jgi:hypothetical protein